MYVGMSPIPISKCIENFLMIRHEKWGSNVTVIRTFNKSIWVKITYIGILHTHRYNFNIRSSRF